MDKFKFELHPDKETRQTTKGGTNFNKQLQEEYSSLDNASLIEQLIAAQIENARLGRQNRILEQKLSRREEELSSLEELLETHTHALHMRNLELESSREQLSISEDRYRFLSLHDSLTGLANRILFTERLREALLNAETQKSCVALIFIDLDLFKIINDTYGHYVGDMVLKETAGRILACIGKKGLAARFGGDEFAIFIEPCLGRSELELMCEKMRMEIRKPIPLGNMRTCFVRASTGFCCYPKEAGTMEAMFEIADKNMYLFKKENRKLKK